MSIESSRVYSDLARLDEEAARAGCALACRLNSADELHCALVQRYLAVRSRPLRPHGLLLCGVLLVALFVMF